MARVLVSWIGQTDLDASRGEPKAGEGPIGQALRARPFDEVVLLSNYSLANTDAYRDWVRPRLQAQLDVRHVALENPTDFTAIYRSVDPVLQEVTARHAREKHPLELTLHLSPGTPAMATMWMLLGKTRYPAELIQSSRERGVVTAAVPFDIVAEFIELVPRLTAQPDAALEARSSGAGREIAKFGDIVYGCRAMSELVKRARKVAARNVDVLIQGETGTGKELFARAIHQSSPRSRGPFVAVNCGALPEELVEAELFGHKKGAFTGATEERKGHFRTAEGGTLFLDEIGELPLQAQVKLLRAVQERAVVPVGESRPISVDVRLITATHRNLALEVQARRFREDLFYRLSVAVLLLPALRERTGDLGPLIDALLDRANAAGERDEPGYVSKRLSAAAKNFLMSQRWPGNVRELEHTLMRTTVWANQPTISAADVRSALFQGASASSPVGSFELDEGFDLDTHLDELSRQFIQRALEQTHGVKEHARKLLGLRSHQVLTKRMKRLGIEPST